MKKLAGPNPDGKKVDGLKMAAELLGSMKGPEREKLINNLIKANPSMANKIREQMAALETKERSKKSHLKLVK